MTVTLAPSVAPTHLDSALLAGVQSLDITEEERAKVVSRYNLLGYVLSDYWRDSPGANRVFPQGSFLIGTVTRSVGADDIDIDIVVMRDLQRTSTSQADLKADVGCGLRLFCQHSDSGRPTLGESSRCWTLNYPGMHVDVLPAISDGAFDLRRSPSVLITDETVTQWLPSNPIGYAGWFHARARASHDVVHQIDAKGVDVTGVPIRTPKTALHRTVQVMKRHRDIFFTDRLDMRPSSIVLTTLAALAYSGERSVSDALRRIAGHLTEGLGFKDGEWHLPNPAMPDENFVDSWASETWRAGQFHAWLQAFQRDVQAFVGFSTNADLLRRIGAGLGAKAATAAGAAIAAPFQQASASGLLRVQSGTGSISGDNDGKSSRLVSPHTFHGGMMP